MKPAALAALLLAGGVSRRMGSPKAMLEFRGRPLWRVQLEKLQALAPAEIFISAPRDLIFESGDWKILHDDEPGLGPLAGLAAARRAMAADWLLVLAVDLPSMTPNYLRTLCVDAAGRHLGQVPLLDGFHLGLAAIYPRAFLDRVENHLRSADRSLQHFVREGIAAGFLAARPVLETERPLFLNANEPHDYAEAVRRAD